MGFSSPYWIKIIYDRDTYVIDLSHISAFVYASNGKITFWLPDSGNPIVINPQSNPDAYQKVMTYIEQNTGHALE